MPVIAGWLTGEQVSEEVIQETLLALGEVLGQHGGQPARTVQPGAGLLTHFDPAYAVEKNDEPPVLDWVPERRTLVYRRPLSGAHPLYYITDWPAQGNLLFASELKALLAIGAPRRLHLAALDALWRYGFIPAPWTPFEGIQIVPAGSILRWQHAKTVVNPSTDFRLSEPLSSADTSAHLHELLSSTTHHLLPAHENAAPLLALSGAGPGSSLIAYFAAQHTTRPFTLAALGYTKTVNAKAWNGVKHLAELCQQSLLSITGVDQPEFWTATLAALEAPALSTRPLALHQLLHTAVAQTEARSALSGLGTQILCPPRPYTLPSSSPPPIEAILPWYAQTLSPRNESSAFPFWSSDAVQALQATEPWESSLPARKLARHAAQFSTQEDARYYLDLHLRLPDLFVAPAHQLALQEQLALRSPFLHADVLDLLSRLSLQQNSSSDLLAHPALLALEKIPVSHLPLSVPTAALFSDTTTDLWQQTLSPASLQTRNLFSPNTVAALSQQKANESTIRSLLFVFTTQLFCQLFDVDTGIS